VRRSLHLPRGGGGGGSSPAFCYNWSTNFGTDSSGPHVQALAQAMVKEGITTQDRVHASYDQEVASWVSGFQQKYFDEILAPVGLKYGTGYAGPSTRQKLNALYGCNGNPVTSPIPPIAVPGSRPTFCKLLDQNFTVGSTNADVEELQTGLISNGIDIPAISKGQTKGYYGTQTREAQIRARVAERIIAICRPNPNQPQKISLTATPVRSTDGYAVTYRVTLDGTRFDPAAVTIELQCSPTNMNWTGDVGEKMHNQCTNRNENNTGIDMRKVADGDYRSTIKFYNLGLQPESVAATAKSWSGVDVKKLVATDKNFSTIPAGNVTTSQSSVDTDNSPDYSVSPVFPNDITPQKYPDLFMRGVAKGSYPCSGATPCPNYIFGTEPNPGFGKPTNDAFTTYYDFCQSDQQLNESYVVNGSNSKINAVSLSAPTGYVCSNGAFVSSSQSSITPLNSNKIITLGESFSQVFSIDRTSESWNYWSIGSKGDLPDGVYITKSGPTSGLLSGTPTVAGTYQFSVEAYRSINGEGILTFFKLTVLPRSGDQSSPKVLYPNGGESIDISKPFNVAFTPIIGGTHSINLWTAEHSYSLTNTPVIGLSGDKQSITASIPFDYNVPLDGHYKIEICATPAAGTSIPCVYSTNYFTVTSSPNSIPLPLTFPSKSKQTCPTFYALGVYPPATSPLCKLLEGASGTGFVPYVIPTTTYYCPGGYVLSVDKKTCSGLSVSLTQSADLSASIWDAVNEYLRTH
jgi:hypothetical protein